MGEDEGVAVGVGEGVGEGDKVAAGTTSEAETILG